MTQQQIANSDKDSQQEAFDAERIAQQIDSQKSCDLHFDFHCGDKIAKALIKLGFRIYQSGYRCTVASYEVNLQKNDLRLNIVDSALIGPFTQVTTAGE